MVTRKRRDVTFIRTPALLVLYLPLSYTTVTDMCL